jgi:hypothetical protein
MSRADKIAVWGVVVAAIMGLLAALPGIIALTAPPDSPGPGPAPTTSIAPPLVPETVIPTDAPATLPTAVPPRTRVPGPAPTADLPEAAPAPGALVELIGHWSGGGNPSFDQYYESLELVLTADGQYEELRGGISRGAGLYEADNTVIVFQDSGSAPEPTPYRLTQFAGRPTLELKQRSGAVFKLQKLG